jgi:hypothetical protein
VSVKGRSSRSSTSVAVGVTALTAVVWILFAKYLVPQLIVEAYRGQSAPYFNSFISGQSVHPLADYMLSWNAISLRILIGLLGCELATAVLIEPAVQTAVWGGTRTKVIGRSLARSRMVLIYAVLGLIAVGSVISIARGSDYWPFSSYSMYSQIADSYSLTQFRVYGVTVGAQSREFPLEQYSYTQPFDNSRINESFQHLLSKPHGIEDAKMALGDFLGRYDRLRAEGKHDGPAIQEVRLYKVFWRLDQKARNVETPDRKELIAEVSAGGFAATR